MARKLGCARNTISYLVEDYEARRRLSVPDNVSSTLLSETSGLIDEDRKKFIEFVMAGGVKQEHIAPDKKIIGAMRVHKELGLNELADLLKDSVSKPTLIKRIERLDMKGIIRVEGGRRG